MYVCTAMKRYSASLFRQQIARALDEAERGETVIVERRGRCFRLVPEAKTIATKPQPLFQVLDPALLNSDWSWDWKGPGRSPTLKIRRPRARP